MKLSLFFSLIFVVLGISTYLLLATPNSFYDTAIMHGMNNEYFRLEKPPVSIKKGGAYELASFNGLVKSDQKVWKSLHFKNFVIPLPVHHPLFLTLPHIEMKQGNPSIGYKLLDQKEKEVVTLMLKGELSLKQRFRDEVFSLPFFKNRLSRLDTSKVWQDLFTLEMKESRKDTQFKIKRLINDPDMVIFEMLYRMYILKLRMTLFSTSSPRNISFWYKRNMGILELVDDESKVGKPQQYKQELLFFLVKDTVYTFLIRSKLGDYAASSYKEKFLNEIEYMKSDKENAIMLYSEYNTLPYHRKIDQEGMVYLYSAWTHDMERATFFAEMINFMERGSSSYLQVQSLYDFALKKFGSNFSSDMKKLKETQDKKLERKISEEKERELKELRKQKGYIPDRFDSKDHKINFFLDKAKENGINIDKSHGELIGD